MALSISSVLSLNKPKAVLQAVHNNSLLKPVSWSWSGLNPEGDSFPQIMHLSFCSVLCASNSSGVQPRFFNACFLLLATALPSWFLTLFCSLIFSGFSLTRFLYHSACCFLRISGCLYGISVLREKLRREVFSAPPNSSPRPLSPEMFMLCLSFRRLRGSKLPMGLLFLSATVY